MHPGETWKPPKSDIEKGTHSRYEKLTHFESLFGAWGGLLGYLFLDVFRVPSRNHFWAILEPKTPPKWRLLEVNLETFSENAKTLIFETPHQV